ncbi:MAG: hypothetical protein Q8O19_07640, partial [Rectinemataceae bacterium]|nr:hypothetical protein [Rectinemataceae bacterium]
TQSQEERMPVSEFASLSTLCFISFAFTFRVEELYHGVVVLNTHYRKSTDCVRLFVCSLDPPGNVARDLNKYRAKLFQQFGNSSARIFPISIPLLIASGSPNRESPHIGIRKASLIVNIVSKAIEDLDLSFSGSRIVLAGGSWYLGLDSGLPELCRHLAGLDIPISEILRTSDEKNESRPQFLLPGLGFFVCRTDGAGVSPASEDFLPLPDLSFRDCSISAYRVDSADDFTRTTATYWTLLARVKRKTGAGR